MTPILAAAAGLAVLFLIQIVLLWKVARSTRATADATTRVAQLTAALELLTNTTEEGFVNVASELERLGMRPLKAGSTRRETTRRIVAAVRNGHSIDAVASAEALSESEVRLHLGLEAAAEPATAREAAAAARPAAATPAVEAPGVLDELERWMETLATTPQGRGARDAAVRV